MIVDFQHHYTPKKMVEAKGGGTGIGTFFKDGRPGHTYHPLLYDLDAHIVMMDKAGIDIAVLTCGEGYDSDLETCRDINREMKAAEEAYGGRFISLGSAPATGGPDAMKEIARCADEYGFPGIAIVSELQGLALDHEAFEPFWAECQRRGLFVFVHPINHAITWEHMDTDDLHRCVGREFSLIVACIKLIWSGVLDRYPELMVQFGHLAGGVGWYVGRFRSYLEDKEFWGTAESPLHGRKPDHDFMHYIENRLMFDTGGWSGPIDTARYAVQWIERGLMDIPAERMVFATDYPQAVRTDREIVDYVAGVRALGADGAAILGTENAAKLIPGLTG